MDEHQAVWNEKVASKIRKRTPDEAKGEPTFKLGAYFYSLKDMDRANVYWDKAQKLNNDSWNYHRQDWSFLDPAETNKNFLGKRRALTKEYYEPLDLETADSSR